MDRDEIREQGGNAPQETGDDVCLEPRRLRIRPFLVAMLLLSLALAGYIMFPFVNPIVLGIVLSTLFHPLFRWLSRRLGGRENISALLVVLIIHLIIVIPLLSFLSFIVYESLGTVQDIAEWVQSTDFDKDSRRWYVRGLYLLNKYLPFVKISSGELQTQALNLSKNLGQYLLASGTDFLGNTARLLANFFIMLFLVFYFLRDGARMIRHIKYLSPLFEEQENRILERLNAVIRSVFIGSFLTAALQGLAGGIAFAIVGIPPFFWGTLLGLSSLVPVVGTGLVWVPATIYLLAVGKWKMAIFLALWSAIVVGSIDNFARPYLMRGKARMSPLYLFLAIVGGLSVFGLAGLLYGPLALAFASVMLFIYRREYEDLLRETPAIVAPDQEAEVGSPDDTNRL